MTAVAIGTGKFIEFAHGMTSALEASMGGIGGGKEQDGEIVKSINHRTIQPGFFLSFQSPSEEESSTEAKGGIILTMATITGFVEKIKFRNRRNGYYIAAVIDQSDGDEKL